ncbi:hypothetical protein [Streptomyces sp. NPDC001089]
MSSTLEAGAGPVRLVVPVVEPGDIGLVLSVHDLEWDGGYRRWCVTAAEQRRYVLPTELHRWARQLDFERRRILARLPAVFAFSVQYGDVAAHRLSIT